MCDSGGVAGETLADRAADANNANGNHLQGIIHDPGVGGFGPIASAIYTATAGTAAQPVGTEAGCAIDVVNPIE
jgi:hypothetical protein